MIKIKKIYEDDLLCERAVIIFQDSFNNECVVQTEMFDKFSYGEYEFEMRFGSVYKTEDREEYVYIESINNSFSYSIFEENVNKYSGRLQIIDGKSYVKIGDFTFILDCELSEDMKNGDYIKGDHMEIALYVY